MEKITIPFRVKAITWPAVFVLKALCWINPNMSDRYIRVKFFNRFMFGCLVTVAVVLPKIKLWN